MCDASNQLDFADEQFSTVMSRHSLTLPPYMGGDSGGGGVVMLTISLIGYINIQHVVLIL